MSTEEDSHLPSRKIGVAGSVKSWDENVGNATSEIIIIQELISYTVTKLLFANHAHIHRSFMTAQHLFVSLFKSVFQFWRRWAFSFYGGTLSTITPRNVIPSVTNGLSSQTATNINLSYKTLDTSRRMDESAERGWLGRRSCPWQYREIARDSATDKGKHGCRAVEPRKSMLNWRIIPSWQITQINSR